MSQQFFGVRRVAVRVSAEAAAVSLSERPTIVPAALLGDLPAGTTLEFTANPAAMARLAEARARTLHPTRRQQPPGPVGLAPDGAALKPRPETRVAPPAGRIPPTSPAVVGHTHTLQFPAPLPVRAVRALLQGITWIEGFATLGLLRASTAKDLYRSDSPAGIDITSLQQLFGALDVAHQARVGLLELGLPLTSSLGPYRRVVDHSSLRSAIPVTGGRPLSGAAPHGVTMLSLLAAKARAPMPRGGLVLGADRITCRIPGPETNLVEETDVPPTIAEVADAITLLAGEVQAGGIICVPLELVHDSGVWPLEAAPEIWEAVCDATQLGVLVVMSAGNSPWPNALPVELYDFTSNDSGSVIVGRGDPTNDPITHLSIPSPLNDRPSHTRIDCHSWGLDASGLNLEGNSVGASGSSAATMIVGAAAALVQSTHLLVRSSSVPLNPDTLRSWLRTYGSMPSWPNGTHAGAKKIGIQPDIDDIARTQIFEDPWTDSPVQGDIDEIDESVDQRPGPGDAPPSPRG
jgi:hypothetical protein